MLELLGGLRAEGIATAILTNNVRTPYWWRNSAEWVQIGVSVVESRVKS